MTRLIRTIFLFGVLAASGLDAQTAPAQLQLVGEGGVTKSLSAAELDDQFGSTTAIVALTQNAKPLSPEEGPFRLAIGGGGEQRARWLRQLVRLRLVRIG